MQPGSPEHVNLRLDSAQWISSGRISMAEAVEIISRARGFLTRVPGDQAATSFAESVLKDAEQMLSTALAQTPPAGPH
jgi:hypothetical protein